MLMHVDPTPLKLKWVVWIAAVALFGLKIDSINGGHVVRQGPGLPRWRDKESREAF